MSVVIKHNPVLQKNMYDLLSTPEALLQFVSHLTNKERRTAGYLLAEVLLPTLNGPWFWKMFHVFVSYDSKAYLGTFLKAIKVLYVGNALSFDNPELKSFATDSATVIDRQKFLTEVLPLLHTPEEVKLLLEIFDVSAADTRLVYLYKSGTCPCYYCLFNLLKMHDGDMALLGKYCMLLLKKNDVLSKKMASLVNDYFGLNRDLPIGVKEVEPYKLSKLNETYDSFKYILDQI